MEIPSSQGSDRSRENAIAEYSPRSDVVPETDLSDSEDSRFGGNALPVQIAESSSQAPAENNLDTSVDENTVLAESSDLEASQTNGIEDENDWRIAETSSESGEDSGRNASQLLDELSAIYFSPVSYVAETSSESGDERFNDLTNNRLNVSHTDVDTEIELDPLQLPETPYSSGNDILVPETSSESENESTSDEEIVLHTESEDDIYSEISVYEFVVENEVFVPKTSSESDGENHLENLLVSDSMINYTNNARSPSLFSNTYEIETESIPTAIFTDVLAATSSYEDDHEQNQSPNDSGFAFIDPVLISPRSSNDPNSGHHENPISSESDHNDDEDDEQTILHINNVPVQISDRSKELIDRIELFVKSSVEELTNGNRIQILVQNRCDWSNCSIEDERFVLLPLANARCRRIKATFSLSVIFYMLNEIHELLLTNKRCTIRELYYKNVIVTQKQENVNEALKTICCLLDATPWELGVLSTSKGLIAGPLQIYLTDNGVVDCSTDRNGITLPHLATGIVDLRTTATHVLLVEKDTVFKKLLQCDILERWNNTCILITGRGYPDINTRLVLNKLRELHSLPIDIVTDADPYGIEIMLTYRHGSLSMSNLAEALAVPSVRWLGIFPSDIQKFGIQSMPLTREDRRKLDNILNRPFINDHVHRELLIMKQVNLKAEIEGISDSSCTYLIDVYLRNKIDNNHGI